MIWYVAIVAIVNLGLGYGLARYFGAAQPRAYAGALPSEETDDYPTEYADA